jgi:hypothetical protein
LVVVDEHGDRGAGVAFADLELPAGDLEPPWLETRRWTNVGPTWRPPGPINPAAFTSRSHSMA